MVDPIEYLLQKILNPELNIITIMIAVLGIILFVLWTITNFFNNKRLQLILFDIHDKLRTFIDKKNIHSA
jgi:hypothetical protein